MRDLFEEIHRVAGALKKTAFSQENSLLATGGALLRNLEDKGPQSVPALARGRGSSRQNVQIMANRLAGLGGIEFVSNPTHKRSALLRITRHGRGLLAAGMAQEAEFLRRLAADFSVGEIAAALDVLRRLREKLDGDGGRKTSKSEGLGRKLEEPGVIAAVERDEVSEDENSLPYNLL